MTLPTMVTGHFLPADIGGRYTADTHVLVPYSCPPPTYGGATQTKWTKTHRGLSRLTVSGRNSKKQVQPLAITTQYHRYGLVCGGTIRELKV